MLFSGLVLWIGARNSWTNLLSLMDASVDRQLEQDVTDTLMEVSGIRGTHKLRARRAGPFYFVEGHVHVPAAMDVSRSHALVHEAAQAVRQRRPEVEGVILHVEPYKGAARRILVPVVDNAGLSSSVAAQFGRAPWFLLVTLEDGRITSRRTDRNTFVDAGVPVGLAAANHYSKEVGVDVILVREIGEVAYHAWQEHFGEVFQAEEGPAEAAVAAYARGGLPRAPRPIPSSDERSE
jgi:predicted Fe-Mo cluster-binding NifX family protein